jgi:hypothetical protein
MLNKLILIIYILCNSLFVISQDKISSKVTPKKNIKETKYTKWSAKAGGSISVIYLARNIKEKNNEPGFCGGLIYEVNNFVRVSSLYTYFRPINIEPTWYDVKASTLEANLEVMAKFPNKKTLLYPFVGFSYNSYSGYFTGLNDYLNLRESYPINTVIKNHWLGFNFGSGIEHNFGILGLFLDYRMRVGKHENAINIMDVCYTGGLKIRFPYGRLAKALSPKTSDRFHWF